MNIPAADSPRLAVALAPTTAGDICGEDADLSAARAYIATAEGTAAQIAERACDRAGLDFATCPPEILEAATVRAEAVAMELLAENVAAATVASPEFTADVAAFKAHTATAKETAQKPRHRGQAEAVKGYHAKASQSLLSATGRVNRALLAAFPDNGAQWALREANAAVDAYLATLS